MSNKLYPIIEIFDSIQGEGCFLGKTATFVRFAGCNLNCPWCDTDWKHANEFLTAEDIAQRINYNMSMVVFTGGEPMLQDLASIMEIVQAIKPNHQMAIETNGSYDTTVLKERFSSLWVTCSPKPENDWKAVVTPDEWKYVIDDKITADKISKEGIVWLQPQGYDMVNSWKQCMKLAANNPAWRVGVQLHKIMEVR